MNWDGIFTYDNMIVMVEVKAHIDDLKSSCKAKSKGKERIEKALTETKRYFNINDSNNWTKNYYQLSNRLIFVYFLNEKCNIKARLLNIYFLNGYHNPKGNKNVKSVKEWQEAIDEEYELLGIKDNDKIKKYISSVFIYCKIHS